jgi:hypothetical protein
MPTFMKRILTEEGNCSFLFNRIYTVHGLRYFISATSKTYVASYFNMEKVGGDWMIVDDGKVDGYIKQVEPELVEAIKEHEADA